MQSKNKSQIQKKIQNSDFGFSKAKNKTVKFKISQVRRQDL